MRVSDLKIYAKFLSRNKLYTTVSVVGFSISLMFVIILGAYVKQQLSVDDFQKNKDRIFLMTHDGIYTFGNTVAPYIKNKYPEVESFVRLHARDVSVGKRGTEKMTAYAMFADSTFFNVFTIPLIEGDPSTVIAAHNTVVVSRSFANKAYSGDNPIGKNLVINDVECVVTGIMDDMSDNSILPKADFIVNYNFITILWGASWIIDTSNNFGFTTFILEKKGADIRSKTSLILDDFKKEFWFYRNGFTDDLEFIPLKQAYFDASDISFGELNVNSRTTVTIYATISILILLIALLNYINLTVAQSSFRGKESAIKKLLGCSRSSLFRQLLVESFIMTFITFAIGLLLAFATETFFNNALSTQLQLVELITFKIVIISICSIIAISFLAGVIPAFIISNFSPLEVVKGTFSRKVKSSYSKLLIIFQYAVTIALLICSFFIQQQNNYLITKDLGYNRDGVLEMNNGLDSAQLDGFKSELYRIPGVELVSYSSGSPLNAGNNQSWERDGVRYSFQEFYVDSAFFKVFGIKITPTDIPPTKDTYWINQIGYNAVNPDPKTLLAQFGGTEKAQIAGILSDFNFKSLYDAVSSVRIRLRRDDEFPWNIIVKVSGSPSQQSQIADKISKVYSDYTGGEKCDIKFADSIVQEWYKKEQKTSTIMAAFTVLTIVIMVMGVFAMSLYMIRQKQKEIAIRKVNGATENEVLLMLNRGSIVRVLIAFVIAAPVAYYAMSKWLDNFAYKIGLSLWVFLVAGVVVLLLTVVSVSYQTWKATRANPIKYLKNE